MFISSLLVCSYPTCLLLQVMENSSRTGDLLSLNLFQHGNKFFVGRANRVTTSVYNLPGPYFISVWFALRIAPVIIDIFVHKHQEHSSLEAGQIFAAYSACMVPLRLRNPRGCVGRVLALTQ